MAWSVTAEVDSFDEAVEWFDAREPMTQDEYDKLEDTARARAFTLAGQVELQLVQVVFDEMKRAIDKGTPYEAFAEAVGAKLADFPIPGHVLETTFINNVQQSYNTGRWYQITDPELTALRPYLLYDSVLDSRTSPHCLQWDGVIRPASDPCWLSHSPQCHHRCFPADTLVTTDRGVVPIDQVRIGDSVLTHLGRMRAVTEVMQSPSPEKLSRVTFESGRALQGTQSHPALTSRGWVELSALRSGDILLHVTRIAAQSTGLDAVGSRQSLVDLSQRPPAHFEFRESLAMLLQQAELRSALEIVTRHELIDATSGSVFNLEVADDETYVADGFVVHNCRAGLRSIRESEALRRGPTVSLPSEKASQGFGLAPPLRPDITVPNIDRIDNDVWNEFMDRVNGSNAELETEQGRIDEERDERKTG